MGDNLYIILSMVCGTPEAVAMTDSETEYDDYMKTRKTDGLRTMVINRSHPRCPEIEDLYDHDAAIIDYFEDAPITKSEEETAVQLESEIHTHILTQISRLRTELNKDYIKFSRDELRDIAEMIAIFRSHISNCSDEDACVDITEEMNLKELLRHSSMLSVPFKE